MPVALFLRRKGFFRAITDKEQIAAYGCTPGMMCMASLLFSPSWWNMYAVGVGSQSLNIGEHNIPWQNPVFRWNSSERVPVSTLGSVLNFPRLCNQWWSKSQLQLSMRIPPPARGTVRIHQNLQQVSRWPMPQHRDKNASGKRPLRNPVRKSSLQLPPTCNTLWLHRLRIGTHIFLGPIIKLLVGPDWIPTKLVSTETWTQVCSCANVPHA